MTEPTRVSTGIAYFTYDATLNTDSSMIIQQKLDLSGNTTAQTFCENAFNLAAERDISGALLADSDIASTDPNSLVYLGSNDVNVQKTFLSANENSTKAQLIALNAYDMTLGKNNQIPLVSKLGELNTVTSVVHNTFAAAALKKDGSVITWGHSNYGGDLGKVMKYVNSAWTAVEDNSSLLSSGVSVIYAADDAFAALKTDGSVVTWGRYENGGDSSSVDFTGGVVSICSNEEAFAAVKTDGSVVAWGDSNNAGDISDVSNLTSGVVAIYTTSHFFQSAFCAVKDDGNIITWGDSNYGGGLTASGAVDPQIASCIDGFGILNTDGSVMYVGSTRYGTSESSNRIQFPTSLSNPNSVSTLLGNFVAFAALTPNGSVVCWGLNDRGGDTSSVSSSLSSGVSAIYSADQAFAALKTDGSVVTWGSASYGGDSSSVSSSLSSGVSMIYSTWRAFAALKTDGSVVTWGSSSHGGDSSSVSSSLSSGVISIHPNSKAFAALKDDGSVVTWGNSNSGGDSSTTYGGNLSSGVVAIYPSGIDAYRDNPSSQNAFAALKTDGSVVTWGSASYGGDSSNVSDQLKP